MQKSRRNFAKKTVMVAAGAAVAGTATAVMAGTKSVDNEDSLSNGVVVGKSNKKEILYTKTETWEEFYKYAK